MSDEERARDERDDEEQGRAHTRRHASFQWPVVVVLTLVWVLLWGNVTVFNVVSGVLIAFVVLLVFPQPPIEQPLRLRPLGLTRLFGRFAYDLVVASAQVAAEALWFGHQPKNAVIEVQLRSDSDLFLTLTAEFVSLVPGSLLIETSHTTGVLYLHIFGVDDQDDIERARAAALEQERRVVEALATSTELAAYRLRVEEEAA